MADEIREEEKRTQPEDPAAEETSAAKDAQDAGSVSGEESPKPEDGEAAGTAGADETGTDAGEAQDGESESTAQEAPQAGESDDDGHKGFFSRKNKKDKKDVQIEELTDRVRRQMAEFDNFRKRTEKEKAAMYEVGARSVIEKILPVVDSFERGLATVEDHKDDPFAVGMDMTYKQLMTALESMDVHPIEAVGTTFDPNLHNAVMHVEDEQAGENEIVEEFQKGYTYRGSVVRFSMVKVAN